MLSYPTDFPVDAAQVLVESDAGIGNHSCSETQLACWNVCGYVQGQLDAQISSSTSAKTKVPALSHTEAMDTLKKMGASIKSSTAAAPAPGSINWAGLIAALLALLQKLAA